MSARNQSAATAEKILFLPLSRLKKSPDNVRKIPHTKSDIKALAASIAAVGLLQNLVVAPEKGAKGRATGNYLVTAGEGRRLAQMERVRRKEIKASEPVRCVLDTMHSAHEIGLAENAIRTEMHPADQYEAFAALHREQGMSAEDIGARFGVTASVVRQRLKLGAVSPTLIALYRADKMSLDQLTAFAITEDHEKQERVWRDLPWHRRSRSAILEALSEGQVPSDDRRARFVGKDAYLVAGGAIIRDLFDKEGGGYFTDAALLERLACEKLQAEAEKLRAEGWKWVEAAPEFPHEATAHMRHIQPDRVPLSKAEKKKLRAMQERYDAIFEKHDGPLPQKASAEAEKLEAAMEALDRTAYRPKDIARAGAFLCLDHDGDIRIARGYVRREDEPAKRTGKKAKGKAGKAEDGNAALSEALLADLAGHRTLALQNELGKQPGVALMAATHALAAAAFYGHADEVSCLELKARGFTPPPLDGGMKDGIAAKEIAARHEAWAKRMPRKPAQLWSFIAELSEAERLQLLAHCVSLSVNAVRVSDGEARHAATLATATALDMTAYWQPTSASYFGRVAKERILEAVRESVTDAAAKNIAGMKKTAMAEAAEKLVAGKGWLPLSLRTAPAAA